MGDNYQLEMEVPGFAKEDISIELHDGYLNISAKKSNDNDEKDNDGNIIRRERYSGSCSRSFYVGDDIKQEDIKASYNNGELIITLPKNAPKEIDTSSKYIPID
ncbi:heat-shock protein Hsp20 [Erysipelatoclostridium sp. An15]|nr:heat-shock protein Hsp20 [Erysipelatoclostridium sp. An15]